MPVGITYEILDIAVCVDLDMVEHIPEDISQSHAAQCICVNYCETRCHIPQIYEFILKLSDVTGGILSARQ